MAFKYFKTFTSGSVADGASYEDSWTSDEPLVIRKVYLRRTDGSAFTDSLFYFKVVGDVYTHPEVPAVLLAGTPNQVPELNIPFPAGAKLDFTFENHEGAAVSVFVVFEAHSM